MSKRKTRLPDTEQLELVPVKRKRLVGPSFADDLLLNAAVDIHQNRESTDLAFMARQLVQCTLPHSDPGNVPVWRRTNGNLTLKIIPDIDKANNSLYPYGSIPRLLLFWLVTEAKQKKSRRIELGKSLADFMREIGLNPRTGGGKRGDAKRLQEQMKRLINARISFESETETHGRYLHMDVSSSAELWWDGKRTLQSNLWDSWIELGEKFYEAITASAVPVDLRALRALKKSPLALDLYAWFTYTAFIAGKTRKDRVVPWEGLQGQLGGEYSDIKNFRAKVSNTIKKIRIVYPELRVQITPAGLTVMPSKTAIPSKTH
jgi:hypothetical protein